MGALIPKRWARRAVTRNLLRRQIYQMSERLEHLFPPVAHVVRLRAEFDRKVYISAASDKLRLAAAAELSSLMGLAAAPGAISRGAPDS